MKNIYDGNKKHSERANLNQDSLLPPYWPWQRYALNQLPSNSNLEDILMMIIQSQQYLLQNIHNLSSNLEHRRINTLSHTPSHPFSHTFTHLDTGVQIPSLVALLYRGNYHDHSKLACFIHYIYIEKTILRTTRNYHSHQVILLYIVSCIQWTRHELYEYGGWVVIALQSHKLTVSGLRREGDCILIKSTLYISIYLAQSLN